MILKRRSSKQGFTLVEALLSATILLITITIWSSIRVAQTKVQAKSTKDLNLANILDGMISEVLSAPADFPPVMDPANSNDYLIYIKCVNGQAIDVPALTMPASAPAGDAGLGYRLVPISMMSGNVRNQVNSGSGKYCGENTVEVHVRYRTLYNACVSVLEIQKNATTNATFVAKAMAKAALVTPQLAKAVETIQIVGTADDAHDACAGVSSYTPTVLSSPANVILNPSL